MEWLEISLQVEPEVAEAVADVFSRYAPGGVAYQQNARALTGQEWRPDGPLEPLVTVRAYLPMDADVQVKRRQIEQGLWYLGRIRPMPAPQFRTIAEEQWADTWKEHFHVTRIGRHVVIKPTWRTYTPAPDDVVVELDPGQAFGTGLHPTTQMCLAAIEDHMPPGATVLDLGTGSGILAIVAARLGAARVLATDIDPLAVQAAQANITANGVDQQVSVQPGSLATLGGATFDFALVNILAKIIVELCDQGLGQVIRPGGLAVFAGLIDIQEQEVRAALVRARLDVIARTQDKDWVSLVCQRA